MLPLPVKVFLAVIGTATTFPAVYDQRQFGKTNVRLDVRDAVLIAFGDGSEFGGDYDYSYDYSDLTIKPPLESSSTTTITTITTTTTTTPSTTPAPTPPKATTSPIQSTSNSVFLDANNKSVIFSFETPNNDSWRKSGHVFGIVPGTAAKPHHHQGGNLRRNRLPTSSSGGSLSPGGRASSGTASPKPEILPSNRNCSSGFYLDDLNRCKRIVGRPKTVERPRFP